MVMVEQRRQVRSKKETRKSTEPQWPVFTSGDGVAATGNTNVSKPERLLRPRLARPQGTDTVCFAFAFS